jgi:hypothetical protein
LIDTSLCEGDSFDAFLATMQKAGCEVKRGKYLAFKIPGGKRFIRCDSLGEDYTEGSLRERLAGKRIDTPKPKIIAAAMAENRPNMLIDIQSKMQQGKGEGYRHWATRFNLKEMSKTLIFLQENGIGSYDDLVMQAISASADFNGGLEKIKAAEARLADISELQKHIGVYGKTREVYHLYKVSGWSDDFYETHRADITLHKAAKQYFDSLGLKKLPPMQSLKQEYATLLAEKKKMYAGYHEMKEKSRALLTARRNAEQILGIMPETKNYGKHHHIHNTNSHEL